MLTRTPEQIALSETSRLCQQIVDLGADAATQVTDARLKRLLEQLIEVHDAVRSRVDARIRDTGDLPRMPDTDRENLKELATRVKEAFASDPASVVLDERIADEEALLAHLDDALAQGIDLDPETHACLVEAKRTARQALESLMEARAKHSS